MKNFKKLYFFSSYSPFFIILINLMTIDVILSGAGNLFWHALGCLVIINNNMFHYMFNEYKKKEEKQIYFLVSQIPKLTLVMSFSIAFAMFLTRIN